MARLWGGSVRRPKDTMGLKVRPTQKKNSRELGVRK